MLIGRQDDAPTIWLRRAERVGRGVCDLDAPRLRLHCGVT
jgi:hypothetical protein